MNHSTSPPACDLHRHAQRDYHDRLGRLQQNSKYWRQGTFGALFITVLSLSDNWYLASQSRTIPYIVQVDRFGQPIFKGAAQYSSANNPLIIRAVLEDWIRKSRSVLADPRAQRHYIDFVYAFLLRNSTAFNTLSTWYSRRQPFALGQKETVDVTHENAIPIGDAQANTWNVTWDETITKEDGSTSLPTTWSANITFKCGSITLSDERSTLNPTGLEITHFSWTQKH